MLKNVQLLLRSQLWQTAVPKILPIISPFFFFCIMIFILHPNRFSKLVSQIGFPPLSTLWEGRGNKKKLPDNSFIMWSTHRHMAQLLHVRGYDEETVNWTGAHKFSSPLYIRDSERTSPPLSHISWIDFWQTKSVYGWESHVSHRSLLPFMSSASITLYCALTLFLHWRHLPIISSPFPNLAHVSILFLLLLFSPSYFYSAAECRRNMVLNDCAAR